MPKYTEDLENRVHLLESLLEESRQVVYKTQRNLYDLEAKYLQEVDYLKEEIIHLTELLRDDSRDSFSKFLTTEDLNRLKAKYDCEWRGGV